jgi:Holliday junction resolvase-like predicted endonuclease
VANVAVSSAVGAKNELRAAAWLMDQGYEVFRNVSPVGPGDLIAWDIKNGVFIPVDVKTASVTKYPAGTIKTNRAGRITRTGKVYQVWEEQATKTDTYKLNHNTLSPQQKDLGVRLLLVADDFIGWADDHPLKMLDGLVQAHYQAKKQAKSADNSTILLDQGMDVVS